MSESKRDRPVFPIVLYGTPRAENANLEEDESGVKRRPADPDLTPSSPSPSDEDQDQDQAPTLRDPKALPPEAPAPEASAPEAPAPEASAPELPVPFKFSNSSFPKPILGQPTNPNSKDIFPVFPIVLYGTPRAENENPKDDKSGVKQRPADPPPSSPSESEVGGASYLAKPKSTSFFKLKLSKPNLRTTSSFYFNKSLYEWIRNSTRILIERAVSF